MAIVIRVIFAIFDIILIFILALSYDLTRPVNFTDTIFIPKGSSTKIISQLSNQNLNATRFDPRILSFIGTPHHGYLDIGKEPLTKIDFFYKLTVAKPVMINITLIPGETTVIFLKNLASKENLNFVEIEEDFNKTAPFYEGFLVPNTYSFAKGMSGSEIIKNLVHESEKFHQNLAKKYFGKYEKDKWIEILSAASVIQKEAANISEMPIVSSVIQNRLKRNMKLQMDGTLNYGEYSHMKITPERIKNDISKFNTYIYEGLPPTPVCTVSKEAIEAAINPIKSDYLYFMRDKRSGKHVFTKTINEHINQINIQRKIK
ncbi:endolytic transglycosylase MltG [Campylobacter geochelonis]|uniref:Endolytic murein transglycosylase n=1 Tax=Campylobacter geochelonis TaxID=1780362 RepID=A0A128EIQ6_9BACT|nr:endolytic transglycosylase MltG [Campylobacter geochelonis]QKF71348.1 YceG-like protein [Campylobacter geochelonis]CZE48252.1 4-amino-4-deoxychorismate lyase [Campylobacter geochelonis]